MWSKKAYPKPPMRKNIKRPTKEYTIIRIIEIIREKIFQSNSIIAELLEHHLITALNLSIHIHYPIHNGSGVVLGIVPVYTEFSSAIFGVRMERPYRVIQMVGLHLFDRDCAIFGRP